MPTLQAPDAYLTRIGLSSPASLSQVHRAHATSIPFENFDPFCGKPVPLDVEHLEEKLVRRGRGGYCFEHNLLLQAALQSMGIKEVSTFLARVRMGPDGAPRPLNHLLLSVVEDGVTWLADVGFGGGGLLDPIPLEVGTESDQDGWRYRLVEDGAELVLETFVDGEWVEMYGFIPEPVPLVDIEVNNWYTATHPASPFVTGVFAGARRVDRCLSLFVNEEAVLIERAMGESSSTTTVQPGQIPALLAERFDLPGVSIDSSGQLQWAG